MISESGKKSGCRCGFLRVLTVLSVLLPWRSLHAGIAATPISGTITTSTAPTLATISGLSSSGMGEPATLKQLGPGNAADVLFVRHSPYDSNAILVGTSVGGVFLSKDGGVSFTNVSNGLTSRFVADGAFFKRLGTVYIAVATFDGVAVSADSGKTWNLRTNGMKTGVGTNIRGDVKYKYTHPVSRLAASETGVLWAGIGINHTASYSDAGGNYTFAADRCDPYHVYRSTNAGMTWEAVLTLQIGIDADDNGTVEDEECDTGYDEADTVGPAVYQIFINPLDENVVSVATDKGLYVTYEGKKNPSDVTWVRLGNAEPHVSSAGSLGQSWQSCKTTTCTLKEYSGSEKTFVGYDPYGGKSLSLAMPGQTTELPHDAENFPHIHGVGWGLNSRGNGQLLVTVADTGAASDCDDNETQAGYTKDPDLEVFRGGPYVSSNGGKTWKWVAGSSAKSDDGESLGLKAAIRCSDSDALDNTTLYHTIAVDPDDADHIILGARDGNVVVYTGLYESYEKDGASAWRNLTDRTSACAITAEAPDGVYYEYDHCYEGNRSGGMFNDLSSQQAFNVDVPAWEPRRAGALAVSEGTSDSPAVAIAEQGLVMKVSERTGEGETPAYGVANLSQSPMTTSSEWWTGSGMDAFCPFGVAETTGSDGSLNLFAAAADFWLFRYRESGDKWKMIRVNAEYEDAFNLGETIALDDSNAIVADTSSGKIYVHNYKNGKSSSNGIFRSTDKRGENFDIIGGCKYLDGEKCESSDYRAYPNEAQTTDLVITYSGGKSKYLLAATANKGIWQYDISSFSSLTPGAGEWTQLKSSDGCPPADAGYEVTDLYASPDYAGVALATVRYSADGSSNGEGDGLDENGTVLSHEGVYLLNVSSNPAKCALLQKIDAASTLPAHVVRAPAAVGIAKSRYFNKTFVVAAGQYGEGSEKKTATYKTYPAVYRAAIDLTSASTAAKTLTWTKTAYLSPTDTKPSSLVDEFSGDGGLALTSVVSLSDPTASTADSTMSSTDGDSLDNFKYRRFTTLAVSPTRPYTILFGLEMYSGSVDQTMVRQVFVSEDAGATLRVASEVDALPIKEMRRIQFSDDGSRLYFSTKCASLYRACGAFGTADCE